MTFPLTSLYPYGQAFRDSYYIDIQLGGSATNKLRYRVIKPLKAAEYCQRILWRNCYGGISFFDFTGGKTIENNITTNTYQKQNFDYYDYDIYTRNELDKPYNIDVKTTYTLKSHLMDADGRWIFNDLLLSKKVWTNINGESYIIIIDSINVDETDNNNIYQATVKFHFSMSPSSL